MATANEHVLLSHPDKLVLLAEIPAADSQASVTFRLLVQQCSDYGGGPVDVDTMEDVVCRVPLRDLGRQGAAERAFGDLVSRLDTPTLRLEVATETQRAAARVQATCDAAEDLGGVEFRLRDQQTDAGYEDDDDDEDGCGAQFSVRPYRGGALARQEGNLLLSGFEARSDGPELTEQHELTSYDMHRLVQLALEGGGSMEDDEAYQRAMAGGTSLSRASRAAMVDQALQSANQPQHHQQTRSPSQIFPMRTGL
ncbi:unnamed protein product [Alopecurus aequalis]